MNSARPSILQAHLRLRIQLGMAPAMKAAAEQIPVRIPIQSMTANTMTLVISATAEPMAYLVTFAANAEREKRCASGKERRRTYRSDTTIPDPSGCARKNGVRRRVATRFSVHRRRNRSAR